MCIRDSDITQEVVFTNTVTNSPVRGAGRPNAAYAMERVIETVARHLNIERDEIRRRNFVNKDDFPYQTGLIHFNGRPMTYDSGDYHSLLEKALELADYSGFSRRQKEARKEGRFLGIGISSCIEDTGVGPYEGVTIRVDPLGKIYVSSGAASQGQGHKTILRQIVADELHVDIDDCISCRMCERACPVDCIKIEDVKPKKVDEAMSDAYGMDQTNTAEQVEGSVTFRQEKNTDKGSVSIEASADDMQELAKVLKLAGLTLPKDMNADQDPMQPAEEPEVVVPDEDDGKQPTMNFPKTDVDPNMSQDKAVLTSVIRDKLRDYLKNSQR